MGKIVTFITMLVIIDLLFLLTGTLLLSDLGTQSIGSMIFNTILNTGNLTAGQLFVQLIGDLGQLFNSGTGLLSLGASALIVAIAVATRSDRLSFIPIAAALALLINDFVVITAYLISLNGPLGLTIMAPVMIIYTLSVLEWVKDRD